MTLVQGMDLTPDHAWFDLAIGLYTERRITFGRTAALAGMGQPDFMQLHIPLHYDASALEEDLMVVREAE